MVSPPGPHAQLTRSGPTPFAELNELVDGVAGQARDILGSVFVGAYLQGSFALGGADEHSDCDFLVVADDRLTEEQERAVRALHAEIPTREGRWCQLLQGSYASAADLASNDRIDTDWLYVGHGSREMQWSPHCNGVYHGGPCTSTGWRSPGRWPVTLSHRSRSTCCATTREGNCPACSPR
jgi:hypothetical protein